MSNQICQSCGTPWGVHKGIMATCEELLRLREELASVRRKNLASSTTKCGSAMQSAELHRELEELRTIRDTLMNYIASQRFQPKQQPTTKKGK